MCHTGRPVSRASGVRAGSFLDPAPHKFTLLVTFVGTIQVT